MVRDESELASAPTRPKAASEETTFVTPPVEVSDVPIVEMTFDDRYDVQGVLGAGGMGEVHVCVDRRIRLLTEPPSVMPAEEREEWERQAGAARRIAAVSGAALMAGNFLFTPFVLWLGVRNW